MIGEMLMVKGIILLEGPDGAGKTTLANRLLELFGGGTYIHAHYRYPDNMPIYHAAILRKAIKLARKGQVVIIDRLHVSEYIYAKVFRGGSKWEWMLDAFNYWCDKNSVVKVLCIPSTAKQGIEWFEAAREERPEMYTNIEEVIREYMRYSSQDKSFIVYNKDWSDSLKSVIYSGIKAALEKNK